MLEAEHGISAMSFSRSPRRRSLRILDVDIMSHPIVRVILGVEVLTAILYIAEELDDRGAVPRRRRLLVYIRGKERAPELPRAGVLGFPDPDRGVSSLPAASSADNRNTLARPRDPRPATGTIGHVPVRRNPSDDKVQPLRDANSREAPRSAPRCARASTARLERRR